MSDCCDPAPYRSLFNGREADRRLREYRRRGLDDTAAGLVGYLTGRGLEGRTILEVGGGLGDLHVELLKAGAVSCVNVELSDGYESAAARLLEEEHLTGRVERRLGDFVEQADDVEPADIVVLNRVICCYPWMERMMHAATAKTGSCLALAVPRDRWTGHVFIGVANTFNRIRRCGFRAFIHPVDGIEAAARSAGLEQVFTAKGFVWQGMVFERP